MPMSPYSTMADEMEKIALPRWRKDARLVENRAGGVAAPQYFYVTKDGDPIAGVNMHHDKATASKFTASTAQSYKSKIPGAGRKLMGDIARIHGEFNSGNEVSEPASKALKKMQSNGMKLETNPANVPTKSSFTTNLGKDVPAVAAPNSESAFRLVSKVKQAPKGLIRHSSDHWGLGPNSRGAFRKIVKGVTKIASVHRPADLRVAEHLTAPTKDWKGLEKELKNPAFHAATLKNLGQVDDPKLRKYLEAYGAYASSKDFVAEMQSRTNPSTYYKIKKLPGGGFGCGCKDWQYVHSVNGTDCDHIEHMKKLVRQKGKRP